MAKVKEAMSQFRNEHPINFTKLYDNLTDLYLYINSFGKRTFKGLEDGDILLELIYSNFDYQISSKLIEIAINIRILDERFFTAVLITEKPSSKSPSFNCGELQKNISSTEVVNLSLRESCNKIIHCTDIKTFGIPYEDDEKLELTLFGSHGEAEWRSTIDLHKFILSTIKFLDKAEQFFTDNDWDN